MSHSQFHCNARVYLDMHGLIFETSICYWQDQPGSRAPGEEERGRAPPLGSGAPPLRPAGPAGLPPAGKEQGPAARHGGPTGTTSPTRSAPGTGTGERERDAGAGERGDRRGARARASPRGFPSPPQRAPGATQEGRRKRRGEPPKRAPRPCAFPGSPGYASRVTGPRKREASENLVPSALLSPLSTARPGDDREGVGGSPTTRAGCAPG